MTINAVLLSFALLVQQPAPTPPPQRPAEITISVDEYLRLKNCEAQMKQSKQPSKNKFYYVALGVVSAIALVAIAKRKKEQ